MKRCFAILIAFIFPVIMFAQPAAKEATFENICLSDTEQILLRLINEYRQLNHLKSVTVSKSLSYVARIHAYDLSDHHKQGTRCNMHSWSDNGKWTPCCYTDDHKKARCMWDKPRELTNYPANGYEISFYTTRKYPSPEAMAKDILDGWKKSHSHNEVIINRGVWKDINWKAIGIGISENYATVWFGEEEDPLGEPCRE
jgi:hypothetical protein